MHLLNKSSVFFSIFYRLNRWPVDYGIIEFNDFSLHVDLFQYLFLLCSRLYSLFIFLFSFCSHVFLRMFAMLICMCMVIFSVQIVDIRCQKAISQIKQWHIWIIFMLAHTCTHGKNCKQNCYRGPNGREGGREEREKVFQVHFAYSLLLEKFFFALCRVSSCPCLC